jgi:hypothetical protein
MNLQNNNYNYDYILYQEKEYLDLDKMFNDARRVPKSVHLEYKDEEAVIFKGIKIVRNEDGVQLYNTEHDMYKRIYDIRLFLEYGFEYGVLSFCSEKYQRKLKKVENSIQDEISKRKNHKRIGFLKTSRETLIQKYNEVTRRIKEIEGR